MTEQESDALAFLMGREHPNDHGMFRRALVELLKGRAPLPDHIRIALANALSESSRSHMSLTLTQRSAGNPARHAETALHQLRIGEQVYRNMLINRAKVGRNQISVCVDDVARETGYSRRMVMDCWSKWRRAIGIAVEDALPPTSDLDLAIATVSEKRGLDSIVVRSAWEAYIGGPKAVQSNISD